MASQAIQGLATIGIFIFAGALTGTILNAYDEEGSSFLRIGRLLVGSSLTQLSLAPFNKTSTATAEISYGTYAGMEATHATPLGNPLRRLSDRLGKRMVALKDRIVRRWNGESELPLSFPGGNNENHVKTSYDDLPVDLQNLEEANKQLDNSFSEVREAIEGL